MTSAKSTVTRPQQRIRKSAFATVTIAIALASVVFSGSQASAAGTAPAIGSAVSTYVVDVPSGGFSARPRLTASATGVTGTPTPTLTYQWQTGSTASGTFADITGATSATYQSKFADRNTFLRARVTATNASGATTTNTDPVRFEYYSGSGVKDVTVPTGTASVSLYMTGAAGQNYNNYYAPLPGGMVSGTFPVTANQVISMHTGQGTTVNLTGTGLSGYTGGLGSGTDSSGNYPKTYAWKQGGAASLIQLRNSDGSQSKLIVAGGGAGKGQTVYDTGIYAWAYSRDSSGSPMTTASTNGGSGSGRAGGGGGASGGAAGDSGTRTVEIFGSGYSHFQEVGFNGYPGTSSTAGISTLTSATFAYDSMINDLETYTNGFITAVFTVQVRSNPSVTWAPTNTALTGDLSPATPNSLATSSSTGAITYSVASFTTSTCTVNSTTAMLTFTGVGDCTVRATSAETSTHNSGFSDVVFHILREPQILTWAPTTSLTTTQSGNLPSSIATGLGSPVMSYSVVAGFTTNTCSVDSSTGALTYTGTGSCTIRATAAQTSSYNAGAIDATFSVGLAPQSISWNPTTALATNASPSAASSANALGSAPLTFTKVSNTNSSCAVDVTTGALTFSGVGECVVRASASATSMYAAGSLDRTFTISKGTPVATWNPTLGLIATAGTETFRAASFSDTSGAVSYAVSSAGTTGCSLPSSASRVLSFTGAGSCSVVATVAETTEFQAVSTTKTFAVGRDSQTITWVPTTSLTGATTSVNMAPATTTGNGAITYAVTGVSGAACTIATPSTPTLTYTSIGSCTVTATARETNLYAAATISATFTISAATPTLTWTPSRALFLTASPTALSSQASSTSAGAISYSVSNAGITHCAVDSTTGAISFTTLGNCEITATSAATSLFSSGAIAVTFTVSRTPQSITLQSTTPSITTGGSASLSSTGFLGTGARTYSLTSGSNCTLVGTRISTRAAGTCIIAVSIAQDDLYAIASDTLTIAVNDPPAPPSGGGASSGSSESNASNTSPNSSSTANRPNGPAQLDQGSATVLMNAGSEATTAGNGTSVGKRLGLPPAPVTMKVEPIAGQNRARVTAFLPKRSGPDEILRTVVVVRDQQGKIVSRVSISVTNSDSTVSVDVPYSAAGYTVSVYNVNNLGVSAGGLATSPLVNASTITQRSAAGTPTLFGTIVSTPIYFAGGSAALDNSDRQQLRKVAVQAKTSGQRLFVTGFARLGGSDASTLESISTERARSVASYLASQGVQVWIRYYGAGSLRGTGAPSDRRVEIRASNERIPRSMVR